MRILIIEDEKDLAILLQRKLEEEKFVLDIALDGKRGLFLARTEPYALIILDLILPDIDGIELLKELRRLGSNSFIIILTAKDRPSDKIKGLEAGADDYITKPFSFRELILRISNLLRRRSPELIDVLKAGDLVLNLTKREVERGGKKIDLSTKEYLTLQYLMQNIGKVISREEILENVWDYEHNSFSNIVDVYIRHLRQKIDRDFEIKKIRTIKGAGYKLEP